MLATLLIKMPCLLLKTCPSFVRRINTHPEPHRNQNLKVLETSLLPKLGVIDIAPILCIVPIKVFTGGFKLT